VIVLGFDPGLASAGIAVIRTGVQLPEILLAETVRTKARLSPEERIRAIWDRLCERATGFAPAVIGSEGQIQTWLAQNRRGVTSADAALVLRVWGLADAAAGLVGARHVVVEPQAIKIAVLGPGARSAGKDAVKTMVMRLGQSPSFGADVRLTEHSADAVAAAIAAERRARIPEILADKARNRRRVR
jgi:Holliday junction resolvasome RuvABC endonuclease subunit